MLRAGHHRALPPWHVLIVKPPVAVSTAAAYERLDRIDRPSRARNASVSIAALTALQRADFPEVERLLSIRPHYMTQLPCPALNDLANLLPHQVRPAL